MICLIKPQFEAGKENVEKGGVVRDSKVHQEVIINVIEYAKTLDYSIKGLTFSSIKGPAGNIEYLVWLTTEAIENTYDVSEIVKVAFETLNN